MPEAISSEDIRKVVSHMIPEQDIGIKKLLEKVGLRSGKVYAVKRELMRQGHMTEVRRKHPDGALITYHKDKMAEPQTPVTKRVATNGVSAPVTDRAERLWVRMRAKELQITKLQEELAQLKKQIVEVMNV